jgi:hypothetical protein
LRELFTQQLNVLLLNSGFVKLLEHHWKWLMERDHYFQSCSCGWGTRQTTPFVIVPTKDHTYHVSKWCAEMCWGGGGRGHTCIIHILHTCDLGYGLSMQNLKGHVALNLKRNPKWEKSQITWVFDKCHLPLT